MRSQNSAAMIDATPASSRHEPAERASRPGRSKAPLKSVHWFGDAEDDAVDETLLSFGMTSRACLTALTWTAD